MRPPFGAPAGRTLGLAMLVALLLVALATAAPARAGVCEDAIAAAAQRHGVDRNLMLAIGRVESGLNPWVINAEGAGERFSSHREAVARVSALQAEGVSSIDVGCMQINLRWHPHAFAGLDQAFDPYANADYAARFLRRLRVELGSWTQAAVRYHSASPERQEIYGCAVQAEFDRLRQVAPRPCVYRPGGGVSTAAVERPGGHSGSGIVVLRAPSRTEAPPATAPPPVAADLPEETIPVATTGSGAAPQIIRLADSGRTTIAMLRGPGDEAAEPAGPGAAPTAPPPATAEPVGSEPYQSRARVLVMPGGRQPAPISVIDATAVPAFALD
jgi:hypothetical protein